MKIIFPLFHANVGVTQYSQSEKQVVKTETNGNIGFSSYGTGTVNEKEVRVYFYSFTNGQETFFVELVTDNNDCVNAFNQFLTSLLIDPVSTGAQTNARAKRKAAGAAPAAPAPIM